MPVSLDPKLSTDRVGQDSLFGVSRPDCRSLAGYRVPPRIAIFSWTSVGGQWWEQSKITPVYREKSINFRLVYLAKKLGFRGATAERQLFSIREEVFLKVMKTLD
jgi:hypothetical protein